MCIFSGEVSEVSRTKILVSPIYPAKVFKEERQGRARIYKKPTGNRMQMTIYSNNVTPTKGNLPSAMILPFPLINGTNRVGLLDLQKYPTLFEDLNLLFPEVEERRALSNNAQSWEASDSLAIHRVGNYKVSIVKNFLSFNRLNYKEFNLTKEATEVLGKYYARGYGFIVCILGDKGDYHPFGYAHEIRDNRLFIPTRHFHQHAPDNPFARYYSGSSAAGTKDEDLLEVSPEVQDYFHDTLMQNDDWMRLTAKRQNYKAYRTDTILDWDHEIYLFNAPFTVRTPYLKRAGFTVQQVTSQQMGNKDVYISFDKFPPNIMFGGVKCIHRMKISNLYKYNHDLTVPVTS